MERDKLVLVAKVAAKAHEIWRNEYRAVSGDKPRMKKTKDPDFLSRGIEQVDIASLAYDALPSDWQYENRAGAECAVDQVLAALAHGRELNAEFLEEASAVQHVCWLERNGDWAPPEQKLPYTELSEPEKEKDRFFVREAMSAVQSG